MYVCLHCFWPLTLYIVKKRQKLSRHKALVWYSYVQCIVTQINIWKKIVQCVFLFCFWIMYSSSQQRQSNFNCLRYYLFLWNHLWTQFYNLWTWNCLINMKVYNLEFWNTVILLQMPLTKCFKEMNNTPIRELSVKSPGATSPVKVGTRGGNRHCSVLLWPNKASHVLNLSILFTVKSTLGKARVRKPWQLLWVNPHLYNLYKAIM